MGKMLYFSSLSYDERRMIIDYLFKDVDFIKNVLLEYSHSKRFKEFLLQNEIFSYKELSLHTEKEVKAISNKNFAEKLRCMLKQRGLDFLPSINDARIRKENDTFSSVVQAKKYIIAKNAGIANGDIISIKSSGEQYVVLSCSVYMSLDAKRYEVVYGTKDNKRINANDICSVNNTAYDFKDKMKNIGL